MILHSELSELQIFFVTKSTIFFRSNAFVVFRLVFFVIRRQSLKVHFEGAIFGEHLEKHQCKSAFSVQFQAQNYAENVLCYRCFSRNLAKIYRKAISTNFSRCMQSKNQPSTHPVMFINPVILVVTKGYTHTETVLQTNLSLLQGVKS